MKTHVFVIVPYGVASAEIDDFKQLLLANHRFDPDQPGSKGRFDYLVGPLHKSFHDVVAEGRLPPKVRRTYYGNICECANLPAEMVPGALVTPDGRWHDVTDFGWKMTSEPSAENRAAFARWERRYRELIAAHSDCWVLEFWAHS